MRVTSLLWAAFAAYWGIAAFRVKQTKAKESWVSRITHLVPMGVGFALLFSNALRRGALARRFLPDHPAIQSLGILLTLGGIGLAIWARRTLGQNWSGIVTLKVDHQLIRSGPYAYVRHPIYSGILLAAAATAVTLGEWRGVLGVLIIVLAAVRKARIEDAWLRKQFGREFEEYRRETPALVPKIPS